jgi:hypothetical protein
MHMTRDSFSFYFSILFAHCDGKERKNVRQTQKKKPTINARRPAQRKYVPHYTKRTRKRKKRNPKPTKPTSQSMNIDTANNNSEPQIPPNEAQNTPTPPSSTNRAQNEEEARDNNNVSDDDDESTRHEISGNTDKRVDHTEESTRGMEEDRNCAVEAREITPQTRRRQDEEDENGDEVDEDEDDEEDDDDDAEEDDDEDAEKDDD